MLQVQKHDSQPVFSKVNTDKSHNLYFKAGCWLWWLGLRYLWPNFRWVHYLQQSTKTIKCLLLPVRPWGGKEESLGQRLYYQQRSPSSFLLTAAHQLPHPDVMKVMQGSTALISGPKYQGCYWTTHKCVLLLCHSMPFKTLSATPSNFQLSQGARLQHIQSFCGCFRYPRTSQTTLNA